MPLTENQTEAKLARQLVGQGARVRVLGFKLNDTDRGGDLDRGRGADPKHFIRHNCCP